MEAENYKTMRISPRVSTQVSARKRRRRDPAAQKIKKRYITSLDGLRALAVFAVIFYHLNCQWAQGGLLGVTVFFVLSGYLITGLLVNEIEETGKIDLIHFWMRRVRRLFPAIVLVIVCVTLLCVLFNHPLLTKMRPDIIPSLFWFQNWWYVFRGLSYFQALGDPSPLTHFWSLAIEEQFYLVWPLILLGASKIFGADRKKMSIGCALLAIGSAVLMAVLFDPHADPTRVYYGTDTRAVSLLIGAWMALNWPGQQLTPENTKGVSKTLVNTLDIVGSIALVGLIAMMVFIGGMDPFMYRGGIVLCSVLTAVVLAALVHPRSRLAHIFEAKPLVWIGQRSYGIYLWHYPIILLLKPINPIGVPYTWWFMILAIAITLAASALSYRFVEEPIRRGAIGREWRRIKERGLGVELKRNLKIQVIAPALLCTMVLCTTVVGCATTPDANFVPEGAIKSTGVDVEHAMDLAQQQVENGSTSTSNPPAVEKRNPVLIGDSVPGDSKPQFNSHYDKGLIDCYIGRWLYQAQNVYSEYVAQGIVGNVVILANFSNFEIQDGELDEFYKLIKPEQDLFIVNVVIPDPFQDDTNAKLAAFADAHPNVHLVDWHALCSPEDKMKEYLWDDREHLKPEGAEAYQNLIYDAVKGYL